ncbi:MAG: PD-(D/E)XK nuclease family protein [Duncaniella sp.]|nr:PD-(D/E)XK nuclease family protein [Duncaniella sp.]
MTPFLLQVAEAYYKAGPRRLIDYCFVFPNKRSGTFFTHYLREMALRDNLSFALPEIVTIGDLTASMVTLTEASRIEQLFTLYSAYSEIIGDGDGVDFDRFMFWGEMILSDFDDVDQYLVDAGKLFVNLRRYRDVSSNFLTPEQKEILARYWGAEFEPESPDTFWRHLHYDAPTDLERKFLKLWEVLADLYTRFHASLSARSLASRGMIARRAAESLRHKRLSDLPHSRYIFVGFNVLTTAEIAIMERLKALGAADFYWDAFSPAFAVKGNAAARFIHRNVERFPSLLQLDEPLAPDHFPSITLTAIPSAVGQTKMAGETLQKWGGLTPDGTQGAAPLTDPANAVNTAVVLPDDTLLTPMIHSVPPAYTALNITMGLPMRTTTFASLVSLIVTMQLKASQSRGEWDFFYSDVRRVVSHPLLISVDAEGCRRVMQLFNGPRRYMIPASELQLTVPSLKEIFAPIGDTNSPEQVCDYFVDMLGSLRCRFDSQADSKIQISLIDTYIEAVEQMRRAVKRHGVVMKDTTFIQLLQKTVAGASVSFSGEPIAGLQIMGVLETRALDFDNLILLSMNERIFPRKQFKRSFIPEALRRSYGMATNDFQESIFAYYFYRLISRASNVSIFYDSRNGATFTAEMSRYLTQLIYLHPDSIREHTRGLYHLNTPDHTVISMPRTDEVKRSLRSFLTPGGRKLSASAINTYLNCPLQFYLKVVRHLDTDLPDADYMDNATMGNIVHKVAEKVYKHWEGDADEVKVTVEMLDSVGKGSMLDRLITTSINYYFNRLGKDNDTPLVGEARVMGNLLKHVLLRMFEQEKKFAPFDFIAGEYEIDSTMTLAPDLTINIKQIIDRIDRVYTPGRYGEEAAGRLRIVDYKTGSDETDFNGFDDVFDPDKSDRPKAILQLLYYSQAYREESGYEGPLQPVIYKLSKVFTDGLTPVTYRIDTGKARKEKVVLEDYNDVKDEYLPRLEALVREILLSDKPFTQTTVNDHCKYCLFRSMCRR